MNFAKVSRTGPVYRLVKSWQRPTTLSTRWCARPPCAGPIRELVSPEFWAHHKSVGHNGAILKPINYSREGWERLQHFLRYERFVLSRNLSCMQCRGRGGETIPILDYGQGPWEACGWCEGTGLMTPHARGLWLSLKRQEKRQKSAKSVKKDAPSGV